MQKVKSKIWIAVIGGLFCCAGISQGPNAGRLWWLPALVGLAIIIAWVCWVLPTAKKERERVAAEHAKALRRAKEAEERRKVEHERWKHCFLHDRIGKYYLAYQYNIEFQVEDPEFAQSIMYTGQPEPEVFAADAGIEIRAGDLPLGRYKALGRMVSDWDKRGEPYVLKIQSVDHEACTALLGFYRDKATQYSNREQIVVSLTDVATEDRQKNIFLVSSFDEIALGEDPDKPGAVLAYTLSGEELGCVPQSAASRWLEEDAAFVMVDHVQTVDTEDNSYDCPVIRIFW